MNTTPFAKAFEQHAGSAFARQLVLADVLGERSWSADLEEGTIRFGDDLAFPVQVLGTHSFQDDTWLWGWANKAADLPAAVLSASAELKKAGAELGIAELTEPKFPLDEVSDHMLAMLCSGMTPRTAYYRAPYDGGALFVLVAGLPAEVFAPVDAARATTVLTQLISQFELDHRRCAEGFLQQQAFTVSAQPGALAASRPDAEVRITFDAMGRIAEIGSTLKPQQASKPWWKVW